MAKEICHGVGVRTNAEGDARGGEGGGDGGGDGGEEGDGEGGKGGTAWSSIGGNDQLSSTHTHYTHKAVQSFGVPWRRSTC